MVEWFFATLKQYPEIAIFLTLAIGYYFGRFTFKDLPPGKYSFCMSMINSAVFMFS